jgi:tryptophan synthase beta subunit
MEKQPRVYSGMAKVSNYQRLIIETVIETGSRASAAERLRIKPRTLEDAMYRAFRALNVTNVTDAHYLLTQGVTSRPSQDQRAGTS